MQYTKNTLHALALFSVIMAITGLMGCNRKSIEKSSSDASQKIAYYRDPMHPWITSDKPGDSPDCGMAMVPVYEGDAAANEIRIDPTVIQNMGIQTEVVGKRDLETTIRTNGVIQPDETKLYIVNARVMGYAEKLLVNFKGQFVSKNQTLLELYSPDLVSTQEEYLQALRYDQGEGAGSGSHDLVESSRRRLLNWGIPESAIQALEKKGHVSNTLPIISPVSGVVLDKMVVEGQNITPGMELYKIADLSKVWVVASLYQRDLPLVKLGSQVDVQLSYMSGKTFQGQVTFVSPVLDEQSKTAEVRIEIPNTPQMDLKPEMYATVQIHSPPLKNIIAVPEQAIIRSGKRNIAVVAVESGYFEAREVRLGISANGYVQILDGLHEGEKLVISSQFLIDSESNLRAAIQQMQAVPMQDSMPDTTQTLTAPDSMQRGG